MNGSTNFWGTAHPTLVGLIVGAAGGITLGSVKKLTPSLNVPTPSHAQLTCLIRQQMSAQSGRH